MKIHSLKRVLLLCVAWLGTGLAVRGVDCTSLTIDAVDAGWYDASGFHQPNNNNYFSGDGGSVVSPARNWFAFNIPVLTQSVASAALRIYTYNIDTLDYSEAYELRHVTTPVATVRVGGSGLTNIFTDLGDGPVYGSRTFLATEDNQFVTIALNDSFISSLAAASGGTLALGGKVVSLDGTPQNNEFLFGGSVLGSGTNVHVQLLVTYSNASALTISQQPVSLTLPAGEQAVFQVQVCGGGKPAYQWQRSGTNLPGATNPFLQLLNVFPADSGSYMVLVSNSLTTVTSLVATLTVNNGFAPTGGVYFSSGHSPTSVGDSLTFCSSISGVPAPVYQWQFNGSNLLGQTYSCLSLYNVQTNQSGNYRLIAMNGFGALTSAPISLVVTQTAPSGYIYVTSGSPLPPAGSPVTLCSSISGGPGLSLQWQFNGSNLVGEVANCIYLSNLQSNQSGSYRLVASNSVSVFTSAPIALTVIYAAPTGSIYFANGQSPAPAGSYVTFCSSISGGPVPTIQWQRNGVNLPGQTSTCLTLSYVTSNEAGVYRLVASNSVGIFTSAPIALSVTYAAPSGGIYFSSGASPAPAGSYVSFCSSISGAPNPGLQWQFNGVNLPGQTSPCFALSALSSNQSGLYRLVASNVAGVFTSAPLALAVSYYTPTGGIYVAYGVSPAPAGSDLTLCTTISGGPSPSLQWQRNGVNLPGQTGGCLGLYSVSSNEAGLYRVVASNTLGVFTSAPLAVVVNYFAPTGSIYLSTGQSPAPAGSVVGFCSSISAAPMATYQWQFNSTNLPGQISSCLNLSSVSSNEAGLYRLIASNPVGVFTSAPIALTVHYVAPYGFISPSGLLTPLAAGSFLSLCSTINGSPTPALQWQFNGVNLPGETASCLNMYNLQTNQSGAYRLIASNVVGVLTTAVASVSVIHVPPTASIYLSGGHNPTTIGNSLTLCANLSGAPLPTVQWRFNGTNLPGEISECLFLSNVQTNQSGSYSVVASNTLGVSTSSVVAITIVEPVPVLAYFVYYLPPIPVGGSAYLCAETALPEPATFQWRLNGTNLVDFTNGCFGLYPVQAGNAGNYTVVATTTNSGTYTSPPIALTIYYAPPSSASAQFILGGPASLVGEDVSLNANYLGSPSFVRWRFNGTTLPGQTNGSLFLLGVTTNQAGQYSFTASNVAGMTTSSVVTLNVNYQAPFFSQYPTSQSVVEGATVRFQANARGGPPPVYFLERNGTNVPVPFTYESGYYPITGGFNLFDTTFADAGSYVIIASNFLGASTSAVAMLTVTPAGPLDRWTQRNPLPQSQPLLHVAHGPNQFVAVGERGTILTSPDGSNWALQNRRADVPLKGAAYGGGVFVAVGDGGTILSSTDGTNWAYRYMSPATALNAVTYAAGRFVVVGNAPGINMLVLHSTNGINWDRIPLNSFFGQQCVTYGNGLFVAAGSSSIVTSTDGINWTLAQNVVRQVEGLTYANGLFVAVGDEGSMLVSPDGAFWQARPQMTTRRFLGVAYGAGRFVAAGARGNVFTSTDASTWTAAVSGTPDRLETIDFSGGLFISAGENGTIITSTNGTIWTKQSFGITRDLDGMETANGTIVVVGKGGSILTSADGVHYTPQNAGVTNDLHGVTWGGGLWIAVGEPGIILTSPNAVNWTSRATGITNSLKDATYAGGQWIVVGTQGAIVRSTDGETWTTTFTNPAYDLNDVAYGNGVFLIAGDGLYNQNGSVFRSFDGVGWTQVNFNPGKNLRGITFADGRFVFAGNDGIIYITTDGFNFSYSYPYGGNLRAVTWTHGLWIVVGNDGAILTSPNLGTWTRRASRTFENQHQVVLLDGKLVVIGNRGGILQSGRFVTELEPPVFAAGSGFRLTFKGVLGRTYQVQASTDLLSWNILATFVNPSEHTEFTDTNAVQLPLRFYRLVEP